jgi:hypothetical protein
LEEIVILDSEAAEAAECEDTSKVCADKAYDSEKIDEFLDMKSSAGWFFVYERPKIAPR